MIKRFTGGGTVIVDDSTIFTTFILNHSEHVKPFPKEIMQWSGRFFKPLFDEISSSVCLFLSVGHFVGISTAGR